jgi:hypothetical protein
VRITQRAGWLVRTASVRPTIPGDRYENVQLVRIGGQALGASTTDPGTVLETDRGGLLRAPEAAEGQKKSW